MVDQSFWSTPHGWSSSVFKEINDAIGGFFEADPSNLSWNKLDSLWLMIWSSSIRHILKFLVLEVLFSCYLLRFAVEDFAFSTGKHCRVLDSSSNTLPSRHLATTKVKAQQGSH
uniref:Uncharacterized protein n=1 Tax=Nelumbo nucifera TaxID=4432 RepID=A0A822ZJV5_NELNU|nr:TPA_asm: hypothetical protein HUJ06_001945 [Nelumbo nucifera]